MSAETSPRRPPETWRPPLAAPQVSGFHVALDTSLARRAPDAPEEILINGFLLLDGGGYELCTAHLGVPLFWQMTAMDMFGATRQAAAQSRDKGLPPAASVWQVEARMSDCVAGSLGRWNREGGPEGFEAEGAATVHVEGTDRIHHLHIDAIIALDRIWIGARGPRLFEAFEAAALLPGAR